jgi:hypothetical protein
MNARRGVVTTKLCSVGGGVARVDARRAPRARCYFPCIEPFRHQQATAPFETPMKKSPDRSCLDRVLIGENRFQRLLNDTIFARRPKNPLDVSDKQLVTMLCT